MITIMQFAWVFLVVTGSTVPITAYNVTAQRIFGEYGGKSVLRCSVTPANTRIQFIEWHNTAIDGDSIVFIDGPTQKAGSKKRGSFKERDITGQFGNNGSFHELIIEYSRPFDEGPYTCQVETRLGPEWKKAETKLTLVAPYDEPPAIVTIDGSFTVRARCNETGKIPTYRTQNIMYTSFLCRIGGTKPQPTLSWHYTAGVSFVHETEYKLYSRGRTKVQQARRLIDVLWLNKRMISCRAEYPDPRSGQMETITLCLKLEKSLLPPLYHLIGLGTALYFSIFIWMIGGLTNRGENTNDKSRGTLSEDLHVGLFTLRMAGAYIVVHVVMGAIILCYPFVQCTETLTMKEQETDILFSISHTVVGAYLIIRVITLVVCIVIVNTGKLNKFPYGLQHYGRNTFHLTDAILLPGVIALLPVLELHSLRKKPSSEYTQVPLDTGSNDEERCTATGTKQVYVSINTTGDPKKDHLSILTSSETKLFGFDILMSSLYLAGIIWNVVVGACYWEDKALNFQLALVHTGYTSWVIVSILSIWKKRNKKKDEDKRADRSPEVYEFVLQLFCIGLELQDQVCLDKESGTRLKKLGTKIQELTHKLLTLPVTRGYEKWVVQHMPTVKTLSGQLESMKRNNKPSLLLKWTRQLSCDKDTQPKSENTAIANLWKEHRKETLYPQKKGVPKWIIWKVRAVMDRIGSLLEAPELKEKNLHSTNKCKEELKHVNGLLNEEQERWDEIFKNMDTKTLGNTSETTSKAQWTLTYLNKFVRRGAGDNKITLDLQDCGLTAIPGDVYKIKDINVLELSGNSIHTLPKELSNLTTLTHLRVCCSEVREVEKGALSNKLEVLSLAGNQLEQLPADISGCTKLRLLNLRDNDLRQLPPGIPALEVLDVKWNKAMETEMSEDGFDQLQIFYARHCGFNCIPKSIMSSKGVQLLHMSSNKVKTVSPEISMMCGLRDINLFDNQIEELPPALTNCDKLETVTFLENPLKLGKKGSLSLDDWDAIKIYLKASNTSVD